MKNYYLIPITDTSYSFEGESLNSCLKKVNKKIYELEKNTIFNILGECTNELPKKKRNQFALQLLNLEREYRINNIPKNLILYGNEESVREVVTGYEIKPEYSYSLPLRKIEEKRAELYLDANNYEECVFNFFNKIQKRKETREKLKVLKKGK